MSIFAKFKQQTPANSATQPITPPDAPKSDPALAAKPVEGFQKPATKHQFVDAPSEPVKQMAVEVASLAASDTPRSTYSTEGTSLTELVQTEKRRPGRPPGSRNKPKVAPAISPTVTTGGAEILEPTSEIQFESVTVSYGLTLKLGDGKSYEFVRLDCSMTAKGPDADATYEAVLEKVKANVSAEVETLQNAIKNAQRGDK